MRRLNADQRGRIAEKIMEWGNLMFIGLIIAQLVPGISLSPTKVLAGIISFGSAYVFAVYFMRGGGR